MVRREREKGEKKIAEKSKEVLRSIPSSLFVVRLKEKDSRETNKPFDLLHFIFCF